MEIVKVLYRGVEILILDEPTAVLTPQETERLFAVIRNMKDHKSVIIITHKLHEVLMSDRVMLRKGEYVDTVETKDATEGSLTEMMVGKKVELNIERTQPKDTVKRLSVSNLTVYNREGVKVLDDVSFDAYGGEILGIAGISGNGQKELLESVAGLGHCRGKQHKVLRKRKMLEEMKADGVPINGFLDRCSITILGQSITVGVRHGTKFLQEMGFEKLLADCITPTTPG